MLPQFASRSIGRIVPLNFAVGLTIFAIGLFKKVIIADGISAFVDPIFGGAARGIDVTFGEAWTGALAYTFQIYFDFSGYSDMAIGLARLLGFWLPMNFHSPYKSASIIEFWRRWHITLSRFLRDYLYIPLGGNRDGRARRYANLMIVMLLGGLWHGAGWTFIAWGALHGLYLILNHAWRAARRLVRSAPSEPGFGRAGAVLLTFLAVVVGWVLFRAPDFATAERMMAGMAGLNGVFQHVPMATLQAAIGGDIEAMARTYHGMFPNNLLIEGDYLVPWLSGLLVFVWLLPNTQQIMRSYKPVIEGRRELRDGISLAWLRWRPTPVAAFATGLALFTAILHLGRIREFIYFQF